MTFARHADSTLRADAWVESVTLDSKAAAIIAGFIAALRDWRCGESARLQIQNQHVGEHLGIGEMRRSPNVKSPAIMRGFRRYRLVVPLGAAFGSARVPVLFEPIPAVEFDRILAFPVV